MHSFRTPSRILILTFSLSALLSGQQTYCGKPASDILTAKKLFWNKVYREIDSTSSVVFNTSTLDIYRICMNPTAPLVLDSLLRTVADPRKLRVKQGRREFIAEALLRVRRFPFVIDTLKRYNLHPDLALLPVLESGYLDTMVSGQGARGIWQFMASTGKQYGLSPADITDAHKSTGAFARYFSRLLREFNDYPLALTAYHHGEAGIRQKLKNRNGRTLEQILPDLGFESGNYVARFMEIVDIARITGDVTHALESDTALGR
jgi:hypothetical protein